MGAGTSFYLRGLNLGHEQTHDECEKHQTLYRSEDQCMLLIQLPSSKKYVNSFKALLCNPSESDTCFCLFRHHSKDLSLKYFKLLQHILPAFYENHDKVYSKQWLEPILRTALKNPKASPLSIAKRLKLECLTDDASFIKASSTLHQAHMDERKSEKTKRKMSAYASKELIHAFSVDLLREADLQPSPQPTRPEDDSFLHFKRLKSLGSISEDVTAETENGLLAESPRDDRTSMSSNSEQEDDDEGDKDGAFDENDNAKSNTDRRRGSSSLLDEIMPYGRSPVHRAAERGDSNSLRFSLWKGFSDSSIQGERNAIHTAVKKNRLSCTKVLLEHNKLNASLKASHKGNSPLHYATSERMIHLLITNGCDPNIKNNAGETLLHILTKKRRISLMIFLMTCGADVNASGINGKAPLHFAVQMNEQTMVKCLLIFGADPYLENKNGTTPLEMAERGHENSIEVLRILEVYSRFPNVARNYVSPVMRADSGAPVADENVPTCEGPSIMKKTTGKESVLCMDGGGIRGLMSTEMLMVICELCGQKPVELFDWIAGTSTGAYQGLLLAKDVALREILCGYFRLKTNVFSGRRPYSAKNYESLLQDSFGLKNTMDEIKHPRVIVNTVAADFKPAQLHLFRNYDAPYDKKPKLDHEIYEAFKESSDQLIWKAARYSMSAPSYFRPLGESYVDGGFIANNPTLDALNEIQKYNTYYGVKNEKKIRTESLGFARSETRNKRSLDSIGIILSLGTGQLPEKKVPVVDLFPPTSINDAQKVVHGIRSFVDLLLDQTTCTDAQVVDRANSWCESLGLPYFRFNPVMLTPCEMDEQDDVQVIEMIFGTRKFIKDNYKIFREVADILLCKSDNAIDVCTSGESDA